MSRIIIRVVTFIQDEWVYAPHESVPPNYVYYAGDNRGFTPYTANTQRFRTAQQIQVDFTNKKVVVYRNTGITRKKIENTQSNLIAFQEGQANPSCLTHSIISFTDSVARVRIKSNCADPLVPFDVAPALDYDFTISVNKNGFTTVSGQHDGFPAYEIYRQIEFYSVGWNTIYQHDPRRTGDNILALFPPMNYSINVSG